MTVKCLRMLTVATWSVYEHEIENVLEVFGPDDVGYCCVLQGLRAVRDMSRQDGQSAGRLSKSLNWDTLKSEFLKLHLLSSYWYFLLLCSCLPPPLFVCEFFTVLKMNTFHTMKLTFSILFADRTWSNFVLRSGGNFIKFNDLHFAVFTLHAARCSIWNYVV